MMHPHSQIFRMLTTIWQRSIGFTYLLPIKLHPEIYVNISQIYNDQNPLRSVDGDHKKVQIVELKRDDFNYVNGMLFVTTYSSCEEFNGE